MAPRSQPPIPAWLESLPSAPEYRPSEAEFADPMAYLLKISPTASRFGLCKIIPPLPSPSKKSTLSNLSRSFSSLHPSNTSTNTTTKKNKKRTPPPPAPTFSTFHQQLGPTGSQKPISPSGHSYTLHQFETHSRKFQSDYFRRVAAGNALSPLQLEALFWKESTASDKPLVVDHAWGIPGSGFSHPVGAGKRWLSEEAENVGETEWNLRVITQANECPLRFVREEIAGVNSPVIDMGSMFSWFAWHVEDHELYGLDYLHMGSGRSWYAVPRDARQAFEEVVRVHHYAEELNPLVTFAILGEKTTMMSPEVLIESGIPCCRLVQNPGEFVVTFPGAYHSGFCHGFNCGEAVNVATPDWLRFAKEAAVRRACINQPPILSHYQLLYALALSLHSRMPLDGLVQPRSSRLKDKIKSEGKEIVKKLFVDNLVINNYHLNILLNGSSCIVLPKSQTRLQPYRDEAEDVSEALRNEEREGTSGAPGLLDQGLLLSCVACGILSFSCMAVIKPKEKTAKFLMSMDQDSLLEVFRSNGFEDYALCEKGHNARNFESDKTEKGASIQASESLSGVTDHISGMNYQKEPSALDLLAVTYGDTSDSDKESEESPKSSTGSPNQILNKHNTCFSKESRNSKSTVENEAAFSSNSVKSNIITYQRYGNGNKMRRCDKDSTRMHVFCLEHAIEVKKRLCAIGGADIMLLCHPEYPKIEAEAKNLAKELEISFDWKPIDFKRASDQDQDSIKAALEDEEAVPTNSDWAVKLGINLYFSANLCMSPQYRKERMPYNRVIHELFGHGYERNTNNSARKSPRQKKLVMAGNWCGKTWLMDQVHPILCKAGRYRTTDEELVERLCFVCTDEEKVDNTPDSSEEPSPVKTPKRKTPLRKVADDSPSSSNAMVLRKRTTNRSATSTPNVSKSLNNSRKRPASSIVGKQTKASSIDEKQTKERKSKKAKTGFQCDIEDCNMSFKTKKDLELHKRDICPEEGCGKKLFSHKYMKSHQKVHIDERPLECPWKGCGMRFKWSWARTEHIRVHTGDRPYICSERGCGKTFRFVSDFSRHKRKTGHSAKLE